MTIDINLQWPAFSVDLNTVQAWMQANAGSHFCGISANAQCQLHFTADPGDTVKDAVEAYWAALTSASPEATNYQPQSARVAAAAAAQAAALASAHAKLAALGLSDAEIAALRG